MEYKYKGFTIKKGKSNGKTYYYATHDEAKLVCLARPKTLKEMKQRLTTHIERFGKR